MTTKELFQAPNTITIFNILFTSLLHLPITDFEIFFFLIPCPINKYLVASKER